MKKNIIIVRGGGDIATGTIYKLHQSGYPVLVTEIANPSAIRRQVHFRRRSMRKVTLWKALHVILQRI